MEAVKKEENIVLTVSGMNKNFGETRALRNVTLSIREGEIRGLIGENGSGKSTVTSIVAGMQKADSGEMLYMSKQWAPQSMVDALDRGIGMIVQESGTVPGISVAENIFLADIERFRKGLIINRKEMMREAEEILKEIGAEDIPANIPCGMLDIQNRKLVEIARVMRKDPKVLVVDETTTALSQKGRDIIYSIMNRMKDEKKSVLFISHDMDEIMNVCDALTVLRDGEIIRTFEKDEFDEDLIKSSMIGRQLEGDYYRSDWDGSFGEEVVLETEGVYVDGSEPLIDVNIKLHKGEILGIGGLSQCGMHTFGKVLFGAVKPTKGKVLAGGNVIKDEADAMSKSIGYVSKDRDTESLVLDASIKDNISVGGLDKFSKGFLVLSGLENKYVNKQVSNLAIKCQNPNQYVSTLSGGNKQKVVFGKWIGRDSEILILDCPTRGIDIGVKQSMYQLMTSMKKEGKSIVIISEEMSELIGMADRIIVMKDGRQTKELRRNDKPEESDIIKYMI